MSGFDVPIFRLELQNMRQNMAVALANHHEEVEKHVDAVLEKFIAEFDYFKAVRAVAEPLFAEGVNECVRRAMNEFFWDEKIRGAFTEYVRPWAERLAEDFMRKQREDLDAIVKVRERERRKRERAALAGKKKGRGRA